MYNQILNPTSKETNDLIIAVTGHRPHKLGNEYDYEGPYSNYLIDQFTWILQEYKPKEIITGLALGVDTLWVLSGMLQGISFRAAIPFEGQEKMWPPRSQEMYWNILNHPLCLQKVYVSEPGYSAAKMLKRNEWMVDKCGLLVSVWDGSDGGTANCCRFADKVGRRRINIDPKVIKI